MPQAPLRACRCGRLLRGRARCLACRPAFGSSVGSATARGYGRVWLGYRRAALERDGFRCVRCRRQATEVDHVVPRAWGGTDEAENLQSLCGDCHRAKSAREGHASAARRRLPR
jgi:5-methylcytosine-specific restriction endonuclease McrA